MNVKMYAILDLIQIRFMYFCFKIYGNYFYFNNFKLTIKRQIYFKNIVSEPKSYCKMFETKKKY